MRRFDQRLFGLRTAKSTLPATSNSWSDVRSGFPSSSIDRVNGADHRMSFSRSPGKVATVKTSPSTPRLVSARTTILSLDVLLKPANSPRSIEGHSFQRRKRSMTIAI